MAEHVEIRVEELLEERDRFGRRLAVAIVVTTLCGALVAFLQARSVVRHDEAASRAEQWATMASSVQARADEAAQLQIARVRLARRHRVRAEQGLGRGLFVPGADRRGLAQTADDWNALADHADRASARIANSIAREFDEIDRADEEAFPNIDPERDREAHCATRAPDAARAPPALASTMDPDADPGAIDRYVTRSRREGYRLDALRDGATAEAETAEKQFTRFAVSLAVFAVAVFLFGFALTPFGRRYRRLYAAVASTFAVGAAVWGAYASARGPEEPPAGAAAAYADGRVALESGDNPLAIRLLTCAIRLRPEFPAAYVARGQAHSQLGSPQQDVGIVNEGLIDEAQLHRAQKDEERANESDAEDPGLLEDLATETYVHGMRHHDRGDLEHALALHRQALHAAPTNPVPVFNVGTTLLALGRPWRPAYDRAERLMAERPNPGSYVAAALTDLDFVAAQHKDQRAQVLAAKNDVVAAAAEGSGTADGGAAPASGERLAGARLRDLDLVVTPGAMEFDFAVGPSFDPSKDRVYAAVSFLTATGWSALPALSGPVQALLPRSAGKYFQVTAPQDWPSRCPRGGTYRVELYVNGRLAHGGTRAATVHFPQLTHSLLGDLNVDVCRPPDWSPVEHRVPGVADGFVSRDGRSGVLVFDTSAARAAGISVLDQVAIVRRRFARILPKGARFDTGSFGAYVMGASESITLDYRYPGGTMRVGTGVTDADRAVVVIVFGPSATFDVESSPTTLASRDLFYALTTRDVEP